MDSKLMSLESEKRNAILNAALKEFTAKGFDKASTNIIAKDAEISKPLLFHYVGNKQDLFLCVYDYFFDLLDKKYYSKLDFSQQDIFDRLRQSYILQIELIKQHPFIFDFSKLSVATNSEEINKALKKRSTEKHASCSIQLFETIEITKFRKELDIEKCKQFIYWFNIGFANQQLEKIRNRQSIVLDSAAIVSELDDYFDELRKIFYA